MKRDAKPANGKPVKGKLANGKSPETRRRPAEVRRLLVEAAERVIVQKGPAASAQEIAREAGVHRSILYRYYTNAEELIREATLRPFRDFLAMFETLADQPPEEDPRPLWDLLYAFVDTITMSLALHQGFLTKVLADPAAVDKESAATLRRDLSGVIDEIILFSATVGESRGIDVPAMAIRGRFVLAMAAGITTYGEWIFPAGEQALTREQLLEAMVEFILYGAKVVPEKTKKVDREPPPRLGRTADR